MRPREIHSSELRGLRFDVLETGSIHETGHIYEFHYIKEPNSLCCGRCDRSPVKFVLLEERLENSVKVKRVWGLCNYCAPDELKRKIRTGD